ncbi:hypothetical protein JM946_01175 [Steroidobacter sp. S1-65]|uniref:Uncharacterized protein n=1 Tax=Steroidobacter gossypii TaxID=2805490 RepID=A0ABS1WQS6_9GAMM|nr:hypothetical protein [Steroidobacter gossypii]MBM0103330.1 hypothetical protein [Steroidobacter gossypii]
MRDERLYDDLDDELDEDLDMQPTRSRSAWGALESLLLVGVLALIATPAIKGIARRYRVQHPRAAGENEVDKSLKDTYPASDPPAQRYVDIPVNRR